MWRWRYEQIMERRQLIQWLRSGERKRDSTTATQRKKKRKRNEENDKEQIIAEK